MKKVLFVVALVAFSVLLLVACFAGCSDRVPPVLAEAEEVTPVPLTRAIVRPNLISEYNYSNLVTVTSAPTDTSNVVSTDATYAYDSDGYLYFTSSGNLYFTFELPNYNCRFWYFCTYVASSGGSLFVTSNITCLDDANVAQSNLNFYAYRSSAAYMRYQVSPGAYTASNLSIYLGHTIRITVPVSNNGYFFSYFKLETDYLGSESYQSFTGIPVEGFSYLSSSAPVSEQSVLCYPNLLNGADFYELPYYGTPTLSASDEPFYYTDIPTDDFYFDPNYSQFPYVENAVGFSTLDGINYAVPNQKFIKYRYYYKDLMVDEIGVAGSRYVLTYTLRAFITGNLVITIEDDLSNVVTETFVPDINNSIYSLTFPTSGAPSLFNYVDITVTFFAPDENSAVSATLRWSKLEATSNFTGYVPISHSSPDISAYNYINNYDFSSLYSTRFGVNSWYVEDGAGIIDLQSDEEGWRIEGIDTALKLSYVFNELDIPSGTTCTFSLFASTSDLPFDVKIYTDTTTSYVLSRNAHYTKSLGSFVRSIVCTYSDRLKITLEFPSTAGSGSYFLLDYAKFEVGDTFTGFIPSNADLYYRGAEYAVSYNDGVPVEGAYYYFPSSDYSSYGASSSTSFITVFDPFFSYDGFTLPDHSTTYGLGIPVGSRLFTSSYHFDTNLHPNMRYVFAYKFYSVNNADLVFTFFDAGGAHVDLTYTRGLQDYGLIWFAFKYLPSGVLITTDSNTTSSTVYLISYKTERSPFFTGFPLPDVDYNGASVSNYNLGYTSGYISGYSAGSNDTSTTSYNEGYNSGYSSGYGVGKYAGIAQGYEEGISIGSSGNWRSLVSALIDVPVTTIVSFLDFEILGFNMLNILRTVILLSLFFWLLNKMTGK